MLVVVILLQFLLFRNNFKFYILLILGKIFNFSFFQFHIELPKGEYIFGQTFKVMIIWAIFLSNVAGQTLDWSWALCLTWLPVDSNIVQQQGVSSPLIVSISIIVAQIELNENKKCFLCNYPKNIYIFFYYFSLLYCK